MTDTFTHVPAPTAEEIRHHIDQAHRLRARMIRGNVLWAVRFMRLCMAELRRRGSIDAGAYDRIVEAAGAAR